MFPLLSAITADVQLARHDATFTKFCDTGTVAEGNCWCKGGVATAAIGDGSWLWSELVGKPCEAQPADRCDCADGSHCPHEGNWQCSGVNAPQCNPSEELKRCEVTVHGSHGAEKFYLTEVGRRRERKASQAETRPRAPTCMSLLRNLHARAHACALTPCHARRTPLLLCVCWLWQACPSAHPCNRCKESRLQRCALWAPLAVDLCGTTWERVFDKGRSEAMGFVTLSCYPQAFGGALDGPPRGEQHADGDDDAPCDSQIKGDVKRAACEGWCDVASAKDHCKWCKCRACPQVASACASVLRDAEQEQRLRAAFFTRCGSQLDCLSWCNSGNCNNCACAACERCGPPPPKHLLAPPKPSSRAPVANQSHGYLNEPQPRQPQPVSLACPGWCLVGGREDPEVVCKSTKCRACPVCVEALSSGRP